MAAPLLDEPWAGNLGSDARDRYLIPDYARRLPHRCHWNDSGWSDLPYMSSGWLCSRNDIAANVSLWFAIFGVWLTGPGWLDILAGLAFVTLFLRSALFVLCESMTEFRSTDA